MGYNCRNYEFSKNKCKEIFSYQSYRSNDTENVYNFTEITILTSTPTVIYLCESIGFDIYTRKEYKLYKYNCVSMCVNIRGAVIRE